MTRGIHLQGSMGSPALYKMHIVLLCVWLSKGSCLCVPRRSELYFTGRIMVYRALRDRDNVPPGLP